LQLKTYKNMCSCSGNCNCNSTTIPRGPQGPTGSIGPQGLPGADGQDGQDGTPATVELGTVNTGAAGSDVIITNTGPNPSDAIFNFTIPRGDVGETGPIGPAGPAILHYFWGNETTGSDGLVIKHFNSTATPASYMNTNGDSLEIDAVFVIRFPIEVEDITLTFSIKINNSISTTNSFTTTIAEYGLGLILETTDLITLHAKCKIQRTGSRGIASKTEWFISNINDNPVGTPYTGFIKTTNSNLISNSITTVTLPGYDLLPVGNSWNSPQYILLCVEGDSNEPPDNIVYVRHCEIKSFKKI
jgi:hypothetical protein